MKTGILIYPLGIVKQGHGMKWVRFGAIQVNQVQQ